MQDREKRILRACGDGAIQPIFVGCEFLRYAGEDEQAAQKKFRAAMAQLGLTWLPAESKHG